MITGIHHVAISTPDIERLKKFYTEQLGLTFVGESGWPKGTQLSDTIQSLKDSEAKVALFKIGHTFIELFEYSSPTPTPQAADRPVCNHGITHICLDVTDVDTEYARLKEAGMVFHSEPQIIDENFKTVYGRDPDGNVVELQELLKKDGPFAI